MFNLLSAFSAIVENIGDKMETFFTSFSDPTFAVLRSIECILFFALIFYVSKVLKDNDAIHLMVIYWVLILVCGGFALFGSVLFDRTVFILFVLLLSFCLLLLFSVEVKKSIWAVHEKKDVRPVEQKTGTAELPQQQDVERCISDIIKALQNMSKKNVGALLVLSKGSLPKQVLQSGVMVNSEISPQLIEGIFFPKAPLHDGAMIIKGHKILAAGCFLPLSQKLNYPKEFGTRHRAAIGITEVANVISIVVSEETGIISVVKQGNVQRYADYDVLKSVLRDYYWQELPLSDNSGKKRW